MLYTWYVLSMRHGLSQVGWGLEQKRSCSQGTANLITAVIAAAAGAGVAAGAAAAAIAVAVGALYQTKAHYCRSNPYL